MHTTATNNRHATIKRCTAQNVKFNTLHDMQKVKHSTPNNVPVRPNPSSTSPAGYVVHAADEDEVVREDAAQRAPLDVA